MHDAHQDQRVSLVVVGFSPATRLAAIARHLGWTGIVLSDPDRILYHRLALGRAPWWRVYTPGTLAVYARALLHRQRLQPADEDTRQLGGDALIIDGVTTTVWRPRSPDDRPSADQVLHAASVAADRRRTDPE